MKTNVFIDNRKWLDTKTIIHLFSTLYIHPCPKKKTYIKALRGRQNGYITNSLTRSKNDFQKGKTPEYPNI